MQTGLAWTYHFDRRLRERYDLAMDQQLAVDTLRQILAAALPGAHGPAARCLGTDERGSRWVVRLRQTEVLVVLALHPRPILLTALPPQRLRRMQRCAPR